jgi:hypothetical protein
MDNLNMTVLIKIITNKIDTDELLPECSVFHFELGIFRSEIF